MIKVIGPRKQRILVKFVNELKLPFGCAVYIIALFKLADYYENINIVGIGITAAIFGFLMKMVWDKAAYDVDREDDEVMDILKK